MRDIDLVIFKVCVDPKNPSLDEGFVSLPVVNGEIVNDPSFFDLPEDDEGNNTPPNKLILATSTEDGSEWHHIIDITSRITGEPANLSKLAFDEVKAIADHLIEVFQADSRITH